MLKFAMSFVCSLAKLDWPLSRVLDRKTANNCQNIIQATFPVCFNQHAGKPGVDREFGHQPPGFAQSALLIDSVQFVQKPIPVGNEPWVRGFYKRKVFNMTDTHGFHLQNNGSKVGTQDLGLSKLRLRQVVLFCVEANANARCFPPTTPCPLVCGSLGYAFHR